jgi:hypothetical protein
MKWEAPSGLKFGRIAKPEPYIAFSWTTCRGGKAAQEVS